MYISLMLITLALWAWSFIPKAKNFFLHFSLSPRGERVRVRGELNGTSGNDYEAGFDGRQMTYLYSVFTMGLTVMGLEMVVLILFQTALGYLYGQLGLLLAGFMAGMAGGAYLTGSRLDRGVSARAARKVAVIGQGFLGLLMLILGLSLPWLLRWPYLQEDGWGQLIFTAILVSAGLLSGGIFALQADLSRHQGSALSLSAGRLYAVDLLGATLGTLGMSLFIIPCFGPAQALFLGAALNASAVFLLLSARPGKCTG